MNIAQFQMLLEHNVVNIPEINNFVQEFANRTVPPEGQKWFSRKLRNWIINSAPHLAQMTADEVMRTPGLPDFALMAAQRGEEVYSFDLHNPAVEHLRGQMEHISDWFNALHDVATREVASDVDQQDAVESRKLLSKLARIEPEQIHQLSEQWYEQIGKRQSQEKEGVKVVMRFSDGYYVVEYGGSKAIYTLDGNHLQNCMRGGNYWKDILAGSMKVYGIRRPSDEAVVGIRLSGKTLVEVKGKQNKPPVDEYHPYVIGFLNALKPMGGQIADLTNANIYYHDDRYGSFEEVAEKIAETPKCKVFRVDQSLFFKTATVTYRGSLDGNRIYSIPFNDLNFSGRWMLTLLNAMGLEPTGPFVKSLIATYGIVWNQDTGYGTILARGRKIFSFSAFDVWMSQLVDGQGVALFYEGKAKDEDIPPIDIANGRIGTVPRLVLNMLGRDTTIELLTAIGLPPGEELVVKLEYAGIYWNGRTYGRLQDIGKPLGQGQGWILYSINDRNRFAVDDLERTGVTNFTVSKGLVNLETMRDDSSTEHIRQALLVLRSKLKIKQASSVPSGSTYQNFRGTLLLELGDVVKLLEGDPAPEFFEAGMDENDRSVLAKFLTACGKRGDGRDNPTLLKHIFELVKIKTEPYRLVRQSEHRVFDLVIPEYEVRLPSLFRLFVGILTDKQIKQLSGRFGKALTALTRNIEKNQIAKYDVDMMNNWNNWRRHFPPDVVQDLSPVVKELQAACYAAENRVRTEMHEREINKDKYATTVSSRFAALNAARKLRS